MHYPFRYDALVSKKLINFSKKINLTIFSILFLGLLGLVALGLAGCKKDQAESDVDVATSAGGSGTGGEALETKTLVWFAFDGEGLFGFGDFEELDKAYTLPDLPWTEKPSVTGLALQFSPPLFLVNKLGVLSFDAIDSFRLVKLPMLEGLSAQDFFSTEEGLLFRTFRNELFSTSTLSSSDSPPFLYRYNPLTEQAYLYLAAQDLGLSGQAQSTHFQKYKDQWLASFKTEEAGRTFFDYLSMENFNPATAKPISQTQFQNLSVNETLNSRHKYQEPLLRALTAIANSFQEATQLTVSVHTPNAVSKRNLIINSAVSGSAGAENPDATGGASTDDSAEATNERRFPTELKAQGIWNDNRLYLLDAKGTLYRATFPDTKEAAEPSATSAPIVTSVKLPALPENFCYTYFAIDPDRDILISFWEEQNFFMLGKTGGLCLRLSAL